MESDPPGIASKGNGKAHSAQGTFPVSSARPDEYAGRSADMYTINRQDYFKLGYESARESGKTEPDPVFLEALSQQAQAQANSQIPQSFSSSNNIHDRILEEQHQQRSKKRENFVERRDWARKRQFEAERAVADLTSPGLPPGFPYIATFCVVGMFAVSLAPTLQAIFTTNGAGLGFQQWILPFSIAILAALALSVPQVRAATSPHQSQWQRYSPLISGLIAALGLAAFRLKVSDDPEAQAVGWALVGLEVAAVIIAEQIASSYGKRYRYFQELYTELDKKQKLLEVAVHELVQIDGDIAEIDKEEAAFLKFLHDRESMVRAAATLVKDCVSSVEAGYRRGIAENFSDLHRSKNGI